MVDFDRGSYIESGSEWCSADIIERSEKFKMTCKMAATENAHLKFPFLNLYCDVVCRIIGIWGRGIHIWQWNNCSSAFYWIIFIFYSQQVAKTSAMDGWSVFMRWPRWWHNMAIYALNNPIHILLVSGTDSSYWQKFFFLVAWWWRGLVCRLSLCLNFNHSNGGGEGTVWLLTLSDSSSFIPYYGRKPKNKRSLPWFNN